MKTALEMMGILAVEFAVLAVVMWAFRGYQRRLPAPSGPSLCPDRGASGTLACMLPDGHDGKHLDYLPGAGSIQWSTL